MKNNYKLKIICLLCLVTAAFSSCKKDEITEEQKLGANHKNLASAGDEKWDILGYGLDVTGDLLSSDSKSDVSILDMQRFENDFRDRITAKIDVDKSTVGTTIINSGYSAYDYLKDVSNTRSFDAEGNAKIAGTKKDTNGGVSPDLNFSASLKISSTSQDIKSLSSRYSYASVEAQHRVRRIRFTGDVSIELLTQYLTPEFLNNVATQSADYLVQRYGTHIMLDISIGGTIRFNYHGVVLGETNEERKTKAKTGLALSAFGIGIKLTPDKSNLEITKIINETREKDYFGKYYGGTNSGQNISIDKDGMTTEGINLASWQQSVNAGNATLIDVGRAVFLYDFITDPIKKQQVKEAVERYISARQIKELGDVPVYAYYSSTGKDHYFGLGNQPTIGNGYFINEGIVFYAFSQPAEGTVPVYVYYNSNSADHYYGLGNSPTIGNGTFRNEGIAFYAYPKNTPNTRPVYVFYNSNDSDHYLGTGNVPTIGNGTFVNEGPVFNVPL
ncbi:MAG: hypothetical protein J7577_22165 [Sphingobacteriaceae bacterium]|nr:hypothetical protein [Sphingobacteriaceae bacterium]